MRTFEELEKEVLAWADAKGILEHGNTLAQLEKTQEELTETRDAVVGSITMEMADLACDLKPQIKDGFGDMLVTQIIGAHMEGLTTMECLEAALDEIKGRTGKMVNGQFVKD